MLGFRLGLTPSPGVHCHSFDTQLVCPSASDDVCSLAVSPLCPLRSEEVGVLVFVCFSAPLLRLLLPLVPVSVPSSLTTELFQINYARRRGKFSSITEAINIISF